MAKKDDLFTKLHTAGLRKRVARTLSQAIESGEKTAAGRTPKAVSNAAAELRALAATIEDRAKGGPAKRSRAAQKAAATRKAAAAKRSASAKKAAATRAKASR